MYDYNRRVWVRSLKVDGRIAERGYSRSTGRAQYVVSLPDGSDVLTGTDDLRPADYVCDGCGSWRAGAPAESSVVRIGDGTVDDAFIFCFLCAVNDY